jgi:dihydroorotase
MRAMTSRPADILNLPCGRIVRGAPADLILFDLDYPWQVNESKIRSRSRNTSFEGARLAGKVMHTIVGGKIVYSHSEED